MIARTVTAAIVAIALAAVASTALAQPRSSNANAKATTNAKSATNAKATTGTTNPEDTGVPNALQGFQQNRGQPVQIEAARLEVRDKQKVATFSGNVKVVQGDTIMHCKTLVVYYESKTPEGQGPKPAMPAATPGPGGASQISKLEAKGNVVVIQKDQTATGDTGLFDMKSNTVTLLSNVVVSQGPNVLHGERLVVDLTTGVSRVDAGSTNGPVRMLIQNGAPQTGSGISGFRR
jgi:lipopolysaccharide export system protein LptA